MQPDSVKLAQIQRDIDTVNENIRLAWVEMERSPMTREQRVQVRQGINAKIDILQDLLNDRDILMATRK